MVPMSLICTARQSTYTSFFFVPRQVIRVGADVLACSKGLGVSTLTTQHTSHTRITHTLHTHITHTSHTHHTHTHIHTHKHTHTIHTAELGFVHEG